MEQVGKPVRLLAHDMLQLLTQRVRRTRIDTPIAHPSHFFDAKPSQYRNFSAITVLLRAVIPTPRRGQVLVHYGKTRGWRGHAGSPENRKRATLRGGGVGGHLALGRPFFASKTRRWARPNGTRQFGKASQRRAVRAFLVIRTATASIAKYLFFMQMSYGSTFSFESRSKPTLT